MNKPRTDEPGTNRNHNVLLRSFNYLLQAVPEKYRERFEALRRQDRKLQPEYVHQRMQDNMSEIMD